MSKKQIQNTLKKILGALVFLSLFSNQAMAIEENSIASEMKMKIDKTTDLLQNKNMLQTEKVNQIFIMFDPVFDYWSMSKIALGKNWKKITIKQQVAFEKIFTKKLKQSYINKLQLYTDEKVIINKTVKLKRTRIKLYTKLIGKDEDYSIVYKFHKTKTNEQWLIYDVEMIGVSIMKTYRNQFSEFLATKKIENLLEELELKIENN